MTPEWSPSVFWSDTLDNVICHFWQNLSDLWYLKLGLDSQNNFV